MQRRREQVIAVSIAGAILIGVEHRSTSNSGTSTSRFNRGGDSDWSGAQQNAVVTGGQIVSIAGAILIGVERQRS